MSSFYSPSFFSKVLKSYFFDIDRLSNISKKELERFQNKRMVRMVNFAYTVPMYHDIYIKAGVKPDDIKSIKDIYKLPTVSKNDFQKYYPDGIVSSKVNKDNLIKVTTSGTTGKSLSIYVDMFDIVVGLFGYIRSLRAHNINWHKNKLTIIADFAPHTVETGYINRGVQPNLRLNFFLKNMQWLNTNDSPDKVIKEINSFKPDFIGGYTGMMGHLALLKEKGYGKDIAPKVVATTGAPLNSSLKNLIKKSFNAEVFESYGSTETGPIAFTCKMKSTTLCLIMFF
jgi:phenylacetate-CoA ligase